MAYAEKLGKYFEKEDRRQFRQFVRFRDKCMRARDVRLPEELNTLYEIQVNEYTSTRSSRVHK